MSIDEKKTMEEQKRELIEIVSKIEDENIVNNTPLVEVGA